MNTAPPSFPPPPPLVAASEFVPSTGGTFDMRYLNPQFLVDPPADNRAPEFEAAAKREEIYKAFQEREWRGVPLKAWSKERDSLFARLVEMDLPGESLDNLPGIIALYDAEAAKDPKMSPLELIIDVSLYLSSASKLLWLCLHSEEEILRLRTRPALFLSTIEKWSSDNITDAEVFDACMLAARIKNEWKQFRPIYRPSGRAGRDDSGNSQRLY